MNMHSRNHGPGRRPAGDRRGQGSAGARGLFRILAKTVKYGGYLGGIALVGLIFGFLWFQSHISNLRSQPVRTTDAIAVLTGGQYRVATGLRLLESGRGSRLLISGVHEDTSKAALLRASGRDADAARCCIDVGHQATNTVENAIEITDWAVAKGYGSLLIVTSDYHLPRALAEIAALAPGIDLIPHAARKKGSRKLRTRQADASVTASKRLVTEYAKYVAAIVRIRWRK